VANDKQMVQNGHFLTDEEQVALEKWLLTKYVKFLTEFKELYGTVLYYLS
jgi:hypothetical protein